MSNWASKESGWVGVSKIQQIHWTLLNSITITQNHSRKVREIRNNSLNCHIFHSNWFSFLTSHVYCMEWGLLLFSGSLSLFQKKGPSWPSSLVRRDARLKLENIIGGISSSSVRPLENLVYQYQMKQIQLISIKYNTV